MSNPFDEEQDDLTDDETSGTSDNSTIAEIRKAQRSAERKSKAYEKELEELRAFRDLRVAQDRSVAVASAFKEAGLSEKVASLFTKVNVDLAPEEITVDRVREFAVEYEIPTISGDAVPAADKPAEGFTPADTAGPSAPGMVSPEEAMKLSLEERNKLVEQGRVERIERDANGAPVVNWLEGFR